MPAQNSRRVARELALKVLFQVDVGKQPLAEVLEGAEDQLRATVDGPVGQVAHDAQTALKTLAEERIAGAEPEMSAQSARQVRSVATSMTREVRAAAEAASEAAKQAVHAPGPHAVERAEAGLAGAQAQARANLAKLAARDSHYPTVLAELADTAEKRLQQAAAAFRKHVRPAETAAAFMLRLVHGSLEKQREIDRRLASLATGWGLERQAAVDRNIMRLAAYEILYVAEIPTGASINEAVELAKKYSTAESGRFVNGVLGALAAANGMDTGAPPAESAGTAA